MSKTERYIFEGKYRTCTEIAALAQKHQPGQIFSTSKMWYRLHRMSVHDAVYGQSDKMIMCLCGCGREFLSSPSRRYFDSQKCPHRHHRFLIDYGCMQPDEWRLCQCDEWFPVFLFVGTHKHKKYCDNKCSRKFSGAGGAGKQKEGKWDALGKRTQRQIDEALRQIPGPTQWEERYCVGPVVETVKI